MEAACAPVIELLELPRPLLPLLQPDKEKTGSNANIKTKSQNTLLPLYISSSRLARFFLSRFGVSLRRPWTWRRFAQEGEIVSPDVVYES